MTGSLLKRLQDLGLVMAMLLGLASWTATGWAQAPASDPAAPPPIPEPAARPQLDAEGVPIPPKVQGEEVEPEVRISRDEEDSIIEEYSLDGRVYMVKITPKVGPPYYYMDDDGDGRLELQERDRAAWPVKPVYWKVKEW